MEMFPRMSKKLCIVCICSCVIILVLFMLHGSGIRRHVDIMQKIRVMRVTYHVTLLPTPKLVTSLDGARTSLLRPENDFVVPNIVHYVWFGEWAPLRFHHMLSIKSAYMHLKPEKIIFHCDNEPVGQWWKFIKRSIPSSTLEIMKMKPPSKIFENEIILPEHKSDVARMEILMKHGGIYVDTDVLIVKSFDQLRKYNFTMGIEYHGKPGRLNNGVIVSRKGAQFLKLWYNTYKNFTKREWDFHDSQIPYWLQFRHPNLIHVEENSINWPSGKQLDLIYEKLYDWRDNYTIHLWYRLHEFDHNPNDIKKMNTTFGQLARLIYYGKTDLIV